jgi:hypothetical protein
MKKNFQNFGPKEGGSADIHKMKIFKILDPRRGVVQIFKKLKFSKFWTQGGG